MVKLENCRYSVYLALERRAALAPYRRLKDCPARPRVVSPAPILLMAPAQTPAQPPKVDDTAGKISELEIDLMRKDLRDQKKQLVAANLPLTGDEAAGFWPLYDLYTKETIKINDRRYALVKEYADNYKSMTDDQASSYIRRWIEADESASKLRLAWIPKLEKQIGHKKTAMFFQIDRRVSLMMELQLSSQLPLVQP